MRINIPGIGLQDIDIEEIIERSSTIPRPPLNKKRPLPRPPLNQVRPIDSPAKGSSIFDYVASNPSTSGGVSAGLPGGIGMGGAQLGEKITGPGAFDKMFGKQKVRPMPAGRPQPMPVGIPEIINVPGVGPINLAGLRPEIQIPMPETPGSEPWEVKLPEPTSGPYYPEGGSGRVLWEEWNEDDVINENPVIGTRPDGSAVRMYDEDASEYWNKSEVTTGDPWLEENSTRTQPVETTTTETETETETFPPPPPPVNPFKGFVPGNIIGQSFDPKDLSAHQKMVADARARMTPGANIQGGGYLTYDNPILGNKQTQFGGYGQPMPTKPLMNYAGLASPVTYSTPDPDPDKEIIR